MIVVEFGQLGHSLTKSSAWLYCLTVDAGNAKAHSMLIMSEWGKENISS